MSRIAMKKLQLLTATALVMSAAMASSAWATNCDVDPTDCPPTRSDGGGGGADSGPKGVILNRDMGTLMPNSGFDGSSSHNGYATAGQGSNGGGSSGGSSNQGTGKGNVVLSTGNPELDAVAADSGLTVVQPSKNNGELPDVKNDPAYMTAYYKGLDGKVLDGTGTVSTVGPVTTHTFDVARPDGGIDQVRIIDNSETGITTRSITNEMGTTSANYINPSDFRKQYSNAYDQASKGAEFINGVKKFQITRPDGSGYDTVSIHKAQRNGGPVTVTTHSRYKSATDRDGNPLPAQKGPGSVTITDKKSGKTTTMHTHVTGVPSNTGSANRQKIKSDPALLAEAKAKAAAAAPSAPHSTSSNRTASTRAPAHTIAGTEAATQASTVAQNKPKLPVSMTATSVTSAGFMANINAQRAH